MADPAARTQTPSPQRKGVVPMVVAVVAALATVALLVAPAVFGLGSDGSDSESGAPAVVHSEERDPGLVAAERRIPDDPLALGDVDAPVLMVNYSEFQCPFCGKFARDTKPSLMKYVEDGTLRIEWRDFPYLGEESVTAAVAGRAAAEQGRFWEFHDAVFADQQPPNSGGVDDDYLRKKAEEAGLDVEKFTADLEDQGLADAVRRDFEQGQGIGVNGTPAFLVNGQPIMGAQPTEVFVDAIEQAAAEAQ